MDRGGDVQMDFLNFRQLRMVVSRSISGVRQKETAFSNVSGKSLSNAYLLVRNEKVSKKLQRFEVGDVLANSASYL